MYNINMEDSNLSKTMTKNSSFFKLHSQPSSRDPLAFEIAEDPIREQDSIDTRELVTN